VSQEVIEFVERTTAESGVPVKVEDIATIAQVGQLVEAQSIQS